LFAFSPFARKLYDLLFFGLSLSIFPTMGAAPAFTEINIPFLAFDPLEDAELVKVAPELAVFLARALDRFSFLQLLSVTVAEKPFLLLLLREQHPLL